jgi:hypothetical protein
MGKDSLNFTLGSIGLILMLIGLLFLNMPTIATPLTGVGGSILATALVNWLLTRRLESIPIESIIEALAQKTEFMRTKQEVDLSISVQGDQVILEKRHRYHLRNPRRYVRSRNILMYSDESPSQSNASVGYVLVLGPDGTKLEAEALKKYVNWESGKHVFRKTYSLQPGDNNAFEFRTVGYYRLADRLIWTVTDLSENLEVRIRNNTGQDKFTVKVNHHREEDIKKQMKDLSTPDEIVFVFNTEILPYQGFEIMWDLSNTATSLR